MTKTHKKDAIDTIISQWNKEKPGLDLDPMATIGRLKRCAALMQPRLEAVFEQFGLSYWEFDMLATLQRSGAPYCLAPTELFSSLMVTSGTMTHRMTQLEKKGWIERVANKHDARSKLVKLSDEGLKLIDQAVETHVNNEANILQPLTPEERQQLDQSLKTLLALLEPTDD